MRPGAEAGAADQIAPRVTYERELLSGSVIDTVGGLLEAHGIPQKELARRLGVSEARVSRILGGGENLTLNTVAALGRALGVRFAIVPIPFEDRADTPAADDPPPPRWLAHQRRAVAESPTAPGPPSRRRG
jgi:transcriptional regulator with XRE-family HTH domain